VDASLANLPTEVDEVLMAIQVRNGVNYYVAVRAPFGAEPGVQQHGYDHRADEQNRETTFQMHSTPF